MYIVHNILKYWKGIHKLNYRVKPDMLASIYYIGLYNVQYIFDVLQL